MAVTKGLTGVGQTVGASEEQFFEVPEGSATPTAIRVYNESGGADCRVRLLSKRSGPLFKSTDPGTPIPEGQFVELDVDGGIVAGFVTGENAVISWGPVAWTHK